MGFLIFFWNIKISFLFHFVTASFPLKVHTYCVLIINYLNIKSNTLILNMVCFSTESTCHNRTAAPRTRKRLHRRPGAVFTCGTSSFPTRWVVVSITLPNQLLLRRRAMFILRRRGTWGRSAPLNRFTGSWLGWLELVAHDRWKPWKPFFSFPLHPSDLVVEYVTENVGHLWSGRTFDHPHVRNTF